MTAARYEVMQVGSQLNALLKEIGKKKKVRSPVHESSISKYANLVVLI